MRPNYALWTGLWVIAVSLILAAHYFPRFPGDVAVARWVQALVPGDLRWAQVVSRVVDFPWILLSTGLIFGAGLGPGRLARCGALHRLPGGDVGPGNLVKPGGGPAAAFPGTGAGLAAAFGL